MSNAVFPVWCITSNRMLHSCSFISTVRDIVSVLLPLAILQSSVGRYWRCLVNRQHFESLFQEGHTGVFSWCVISWFHFPLKTEFRKLFFVTRDLKVLRDLWRTWIINWKWWSHHSISVILRCESSKWLEGSCIKSDLGMRFANYGTLT